MKRAARRKKAPKSQDLGLISSFLGQLRSNTLVVIVLAGSVVMPKCSGRYTPVSVVGLLLGCIARHMAFSNMALA
ncbi:MAG TPA: hypothetical protein VLC92_21175 [Rhodocyclaceae bacterium]|nr:hypothetical protein [Rhodocyclaceae bacterium]